jgi:hypothetical protein
MFGGCAVIDPADPRRLYVRSDPERGPARTSAGARASTQQWQSDLRLCMHAIDSTLTNLRRAIAEGHVLTARSDARCLAKQAHTLDVLIVSCPDVTA